MKDQPAKGMRSNRKAPLERKKSPPHEEQAEMIMRSDLEAGTIGRDRVVDETSRRRVEPKRPGRRGRRAPKKVKMHRRCDVGEGKPHT